MIGNRLKLLRQSNGLSLQDLADLLTASGLSIGRGAISHYETGITTPNTTTIEVLAKTLGTTPDFFTQKDWEDVDFTIFTPRENSTAKAETQILSFVQIQLEKFLYIDKVLGCHVNLVPPTKIKVGKDDSAAIEEYADKTRRDMLLGMMPISSVSNTLEQYGWKTIEMQEDSPYISGYEHSSKTGFILYPSLFAIDDLRLSMLASIGYASIEGDTPEDTKEAVEHFARAMLFPKSQVLMEFGKDRSEVSISELALAKQKYGISKRQVMRRLLELGIIPKEYFDSFEELMRLHGFPRRKQVLAETVMFFENPINTTMKVLEAYSRGLISKETVDSFLIIKHLP